MCHLACSSVGLVVLAAVVESTGAGHSSRSFTIGITGDVNLNPKIRSPEPAFVWGDVINVTRAVDLMAIQHEGTLAEIPDSDPATIQFEDPLNYTATYAAAGIDFITIANNHQYDFGFEGLNRSLKTLDAIGIPYAGLGWSSDAVRTPKVVRRTLPRGGGDVGGGSVDVDVAFFTLVIDECWVWPNGTLYLDGCTCGASANPKQTPPYQCYEANASMPGLWYHFGIDDALITELSGTIAAYKAANPQHLIVTYLHVGPNFQWQPYPIHEQLLRNASAAGADLVWGTSSHHVQRFEVFDGKPIVYGLGDLLFRHVVGVEDWCPLYARPCSAYRPDLSLMYVFEVEMDAHDTPFIAIGNVTAYGTRHSDLQTSLSTNQTDVLWLVAAFNKQAVGATLVPVEASPGRFRVVVP